MVLFNYAIREITAKVVYYGPGLGGKTTNLQYIHEQLEPGARGKLLSLATDGDRTLFFDFLPIEMGNIGGYKVRFQLYTVPGQVHYNATRKLVLKGVDAVAFVADSQITMLERNRESFENLLQNLAENGYEPSRIPIVVQLNKRDLENVASPAELVASMGVAGYPVHEAVAKRGDGVFETLKAVIKFTLARLRTQFESEGSPGEERDALSPPPPPPAAVFASARQAAARSTGLAAVAEAPPLAEASPLAAEAPASPPETSEGDFEEIDLEELSEAGGGAPEVPGPAAALEEPDVEGAIVEEGIAEPPPERDLSAGEDAAAEEGLDLDESRRNFFDQLGEDSVAEPARASAPGPLAPQEVGPAPAPAWAGEILGELERLRGENRALRAALEGFAAVLDRQITLLQEGRDRLARGAAGVEAGGGQGT